MPFGKKARKVPDPYAEAVEYLCRNADGMREVVGDATWNTAIPVIRDAPPASEPWRNAIRVLHDAALSAGIPGGIGLRSTMGQGFPRQPPPHSSGWVCPGGRCSRIVLRTADAAVPLCALMTQPMRLVE